jgi:hypothetical protein
MLDELRAERDTVDQAIIARERIAAARSGRRGRPPESRNKAKEICSSKSDCWIPPKRRFKWCSR